MTTVRQTQTFCLNGPQGCLIFVEEIREKANFSTKFTVQCLILTFVKQIGRTFQACNMCRVKHRGRLCDLGVKPFQDRHKTLLLTCFNLFQYQF